ncbi:hypothetical protein PanWU01x14_275710 [Parasponia andersonii]|uniref:Coatomer beta subunit n=1 Tax=Parasponia andersonii TaxID=3476 RepID=A0A2P5B355_PARAD|nr:hypothetical protein PanWU01x14_275710 [Parasponia andersonii]
MVRHEAVEALGSIVDDHSMSLLEKSAVDTEPILSQSCEVALSMLEFEHSGKSFEVDVNVWVTAARSVPRASSPRRSTSAPILKTLKEPRNSMAMPKYLFSTMKEIVFTYVSVECSVNEKDPKEIRVGEKGWWDF